MAYRWARDIRQASKSPCSFLPLPKISWGLHFVVNTSNLRGLTTPHAGSFGSGIEASLLPYYLLPQGPDRVCLDVNYTVSFFLSMWRTFVKYLLTSIFLQYTWNKGLQYKNRLLAQINLTFSYQFSTFTAVWALKLCNCLFHFIQDMPIIWTFDLAFRSLYTYGNRIITYLACVSQICCSSLYVFKFFSPWYLNLTIPLFTFQIY